MSYTTLYLVPEKGEIIEFEEYRNSWGSAPFIWSALFDKYLKSPNDPPYTSWMSQSERLWKLAEKGGPLNKNEKICLMSTFDKVMVKKKNLPQLIDAFTWFYKHYKKTGVVCHLMDQVKSFRDLLDRDDCYAVCWCQTSVSDDVWDSERTTEDDDILPWDISKDKGHFFLFDELLTFTFYY